MKREASQRVGRAAGFLTLVAMAACSSGQAEESIQGTWVSEKTFGKRGTFELRGTHLRKAGAVAGTLVMRGGGADLSVSVAGANELSVNPGSSSYNALSVKSDDGRITFSGNDVGTVMGFYEDKGTGDSGAWHEAHDAEPDATVDRAFETTYRFNDLAFDGTSLYGVAAAETAGAQAQLVRIDPASGAVTAVTPSPDCASPSGIAFDGSSFLVTRQVAGTGWLIGRYDASWQRQGSEIQVTGSGLYDAPASVAYGGGKLWCASLLSFGGMTNIDPATGAATRISTVSLNRPGGLDFAGGQLWAADFPPGGVWPELTAYDPATGAQQTAMWAPESKSSTTIAVAGETGFLWVAYGHNLYRLRL